MGASRSVEFFDAQFKKQVETGEFALNPFEPGRYCLLREGALERSFARWEILLARREEFPAPGGKLKRFETVVARRP